MVTLGEMMSIKLIANMAPTAAPANSTVSVAPIYASSLVAPAILLFLVLFRVCSITGVFLVRLSSCGPHPISSATGFTENVY